MRRMQYFAGGQWLETKSGRYTPVYNPSTGEVQAEIPSCTPEEVEYAIACASRAFPAWRDTPVMKRTQILYRFRELLNQHFDELTELCAREHGKNWAESAGDIAKVKEPVELAVGTPSLIMGESPKEQRYNENALFENNREDLIDMSDERTAAIVRAYIQNLQFTYGEYSMAFARCIQNSYLKAGRHSRGIKPQLLRVLYATDMPGVLTEIGFMSNQQELAYMKSDKGQNEIARSLYQAIRNYSVYVLGTRMAEEEQAAAAKPAAEQPAEKSAGKAAEKSVEKPAAKSAEKTAAAQPAEGKAATAAPVRTPERPAVQPLRYTIQVMASASSVPLASAQFRAYRGKVKEYAAEGRFPYKYGVGEYGTREAAQRKLAEVRKVFPGAFVVACRGTQIVK